MIFLISLLVFLAVFFISAKLLEIVLTKKYISHLLAEGSTSSAALPEGLSLAVLPSSRILRNVSLPIPGRDGAEIQLGTVVVSRSGIFILCQLNGSGILENPSEGRWKRIESGKFTEFENPFTLQKDARTLLEYYAATSGVPEVKAHTLVLYTSGALRFTHPKPRGVIFAGEYTQRLKRLEKKGKLTASQVKSICRALRSADVY